jgi:hypothetical protein
MPESKKAKPTPLLTFETVRGDGSTEISVKRAQTGIYLGQVKFDGGHLQYAFYPRSYVVILHRELDEIASYCRARTTVRRELQVRK